MDDRQTSLVSIVSGDGGVIGWTWPELPARSKELHPTQLYSAANAALLSLLLWSFFPFRRRDGQVFALMLTIYPISRFLLEQIRNDEAGQWGTSLTVSQWVSVGILILAGVLWTYLARQPRLELQDDAIKDLKSSESAGDAAA